MLEFRRAHVVVFGRVFVRVDRVARLHRVPHLRVAHHHDVDDALVFVFELVLAQDADAFAARKRVLDARRDEGEQIRIDDVDGTCIRGVQLGKRRLLQFSDAHAAIVGAVRG